MKRLSRKLLSILLALLMVMSTMPLSMITAQAAQYSLLWPTSGTNISSYYGNRNVSVGSSNHKGIDISWSNCHGSDVWAAADGEVIAATQYFNDPGKLWQRGKFVSIYHKDLGITTLYQHLSSYNVSVGQTVKRGQVIGKIGNTGIGTGSHLHFETKTGRQPYSNGTNFDPLGGSVSYSYDRGPGPTPNYKKGVYKCVEKAGVRLRSSASTSSSKIDLIAYNATVNITEVSGYWGKCTYNGKTGWTYLSYYTFVSASVPSAGVPTINAINAEAAQNSQIEVSWNKTANATKYGISINGGAEITTTKTSYPVKLTEAKKYTFKVRAYNSENKASNWSSEKSVTAKAPVTVRFVDWDGTELTNPQIIDWGTGAKAPVSPKREGYSFQGWSDSYTNVKENKTIKALYKIETYTVNFYDKDGNLLKDSEKVEYHKNATVPSDLNVPTGYTFMGWDSDRYNNVYTDDKSKTIDIHGIYQWTNDELPIVATITSATREDDGYYVYFDLTNYPTKKTRGRAIILLKTAEGKLVYTTESAAFSIAAGATKTGMEVFVDSDSSATYAELIIMDNYSTGVPISEKVTATIDQGNSWSDWSTEVPESGNGIEVESRIQYSFRTKETSTGTTTTKDGWIYTGTYTPSYGSWSNWTWDTINKTYNSDGLLTRDVQSEYVVKSYDKKTQYNYNRWHPSANRKAYGPCKGTWNNYYCDTEEWRGWSDSPLSYYKYTSSSATFGGPFYSYGEYTNPWYNPQTRQVDDTSKPNKAWRYRSQNISYTYNFYRWTAWSDWSFDPVTATDTREVDTRTVYRSKNNTTSTENNEGEERTFSEYLDPSLAGKQITLYVYKFDNYSDYTNEYVGQSVIGTDGSYSFTYKLREEPTVKTGDFTIAIGIEGTNHTQVVGTIVAPKPVYTVEFYGDDGTIIDTQQVAEGENAVAPDVPEIEGKIFRGWDKSLTAIKEDTQIFSNYEDKEYSVVFIDWENKIAEMHTFKHGSSIKGYTPELSPVEGYDFVGWDAILDGNDIVTENMIVTAVYDIKQFDINFCDYEGNIVETQRVAYGNNANYPDLETGENGERFAGWFNPEAYQNVEENAYIVPTYDFEETVEAPLANYETGEYTEPIQLTLTTSSANDVIFYYFNTDEENEKIYTGPITIDKTCSITYYATSIGKNDSNKTTAYFCINNAGEPSAWMLDEELPEEVQSNWQEYDLESDIGYRYKDTVSTSSTTEAEQYLSEGWQFDRSDYSAYTPWQDEEITVDETKTGFEIDTQEADDPTVTNYRYSHYKYTDGNGDVQYAKNAVDGYDCEYETVTVDNRLSIAGKVGSDYYYMYDNQMWFTQTKVNGKKTQYRSRYQVNTYYKWTEWTLEAPSSNETREYEENDVFRYYNKNYHLVSPVSELGDYEEIFFVEEGKTFDASQIDLGGYEIDYFNLNEPDGEVFDLSTPITESIFLYINVVPKQYTVTFQMDDGTEIDTQTVNYLEAATAPETDIVPGYVFAGWDKDFSSIIEDTVVTGAYYLESEYARVSLNTDSADMQIGNYVNLIATITPAALQDEKIDWTSSNPNVAVVDAEGHVEAISPGETTITAMVVSTKETAECQIVVLADLKTYLVLKENTILNYDDAGYLRRIKLNTPASSVASEFENKASNLKFFKIDGQELNDNSNVGTGTQVKLYKNGEAIDSKTIIVTGDMTGDGIINNRDVAMFNRYLVQKVTVEDCQALAVDVNGDGYINNRDAAMIARYLVGKDTF